MSKLNIIGWSVSITFFLAVSVWKWWQGREGMKKAQEILRDNPEFVARALSDT